MNSKLARTDFLFARPSFGSGVARVLDLGGAFDAYNVSASEAAADEQAIFNDWAVVGEDLRTVIDRAKARE
jgi:hypothetical protein